MTSASFVAARKRLGLTQPQLAEILDVNYRTISRWETGDVSIPIPVALLIQLWVLLPESRRLVGIDAPQED